jgi:diguanylate cyclase (GGDEF)-like protein
MRKPMKTLDMEGEHINKTNGSSAMTFSVAYVATHLMFAGLLVYSMWGLINDSYVYNWSAIVIIVLLCGLLGQSLFKRKNSVHILNVKKWETTYSYFAGVVSLTLSAGYCYELVIGGAALATSLAFLLALHISCLAASSVSSKKVFVTSLLCLAAPFIATLLTLDSRNTMMLGISLTIFVIVLILLNLSINRAILLGVEMTAKYESEVKLIQKYKKQLRDTTFEDTLTGLFNHRFFNFMINEEIRRAKRAETNLSIVIIEIDCFPEYAEHYGATKGDECIASIAQILEKVTSRGGEFITRFDDAQFALIAPNVCANEATAFVSKIINLVSKANLEHHCTLAENSQLVSISAGISEFKGNNIIDVTEIIEQAQCALNRARQVGYNNAQIFSQNAVKKEEKGVEEIKAVGTLHDLKVAQAR